MARVGECNSGAESEVRQENPRRVLVSRQRCGQCLRERDAVAEDRRVAGGGDGDGDGLSVFAIGWYVASRVVSPMLDDLKRQQVAKGQ